MTTFYTDPHPTPGWRQAADLPPQPARRRAGLWGGVCRRGRGGRPRPGDRTDRQPRPPVRPQAHRADRPVGLRAPAGSVAKLVVGSGLGMIGSAVEGEDADAAKRFFPKALGQPHTVNPRTITVDKNAADPKAVAKLKDADELEVIAAPVSQTTLRANGSGTCSIRPDKARLARVMRKGHNPPKPARRQHSRYSRH